ncbi:hypothetical protein EXH51_12150 [Pelomonas saccharophila]|nr:hypothetical protein [Roseateles saccharophilus]
MNHVRRHAASGPRRTRCRAPRRTASAGHRRGSGAAGRGPCRRHRGPATRTRPKSGLPCSSPTSE